MRRVLHAPGPALLVLIGLLPLPAHCQHGTGIYLGQSEVLQAVPPRQLTLNAHVQQFHYQPGGDSIAYIRQDGEGEHLTQSIEFMDARQSNPDTRTLYRLPRHPERHQGDGKPPDPYALDLYGWSGDGRYLLFDEWNINAIGLPFLKYFCADLGSSPFTVYSVPLPTKTLTGTDYSDPEIAWSPVHQRVLFAQSPVQWDPKAAPLPLAYTVYDPATRTLQPITVASGLDVQGWLDGGHLLAVRRAGGQGGAVTDFSHDIGTGADVPLPKKGLKPPSPDSLLHYGRGITSSTNPKLTDLRLEAQRQPLPDARAAVAAEATAIWVRSSHVVKAMSVLAVTVTPGQDDPQVEWSPDGESMAYIAHGDLFVSDLVKRPATPSEKVAAGEKLECKEERMVIASNLKQLGLGIIQYTQDNDEKFPSGTGWHDTIFPYIKNEDVFNFDGIGLVYHAPTNLSLAAMDSPADTVLATAELPCAHIVLYADGHVKAFNKTGNAMPGDRQGQPQ